MAIVQIRLSGPLSEQLPEEEESNEDEVEIVKAVTQKERKGTPSEHRIRVALSSEVSSRERPRKSGSKNRNRNNKVYNLFIKLKWPCARNTGRSGSGENQKS